MVCLDYHAILLVIRWVSQGVKHELFCHVNVPYVMYHKQHSCLSECGEVDEFGMFALRPRAVMTNLPVGSFITNELISFFLSL